MSPVSLTVFHRNSNSMESSFHLDPITVIATNIAHDTTAVLSWHVQKFVAIWWPAAELQQRAFSIEFELQAEALVRQAHGAWGCFTSHGELFKWASLIRSRHLIADKNATWWAVMFLFPKMRHYKNSYRKPTKVNEAPAYCTKCWKITSAKFYERYT